jgi:hypothetical protein
MNIDDPTTEALRSATGSYRVLLSWLARTRIVARDLTGATTPGGLPLELSDPVVQEFEREFQTLARVAAEAGATLDRIQVLLVKATERESAVVDLAQAKLLRGSSD